MWKIREILPIVGGTVIQGDLQSAFQRLCLDSRQVEPGDLFVALPGSRHDGHEFVADAVQHGAVAVMVQDRVELPASVTVVQVPSTITALQALGKAARDQLRARVIGVTGSAGKTTTKTLMGQVLSLVDATFTSPGNLNSTTGVPLSLFHHAHPSHRFWIQEVGINRAGEMQTLGAILRPHVAVILNALPVHLEGLKNVAKVAEEKAELVRHLEPPGAIVTHGEIAALVEAVARKKPATAQWVTYGTGPECHVFHAQIHLTPNGTSGVLSYSTDSADGPRRTLTWSYPRPLPWLPDAVAATAALLIALGRDLAVLPDGLMHFQPPPHRGQIYTLPADVLIVDDSYNSNPYAVRQAIRYFDAYPQRRACLVLGDMLELGDQSEALHRDLATQLPWDRIALFVGVGRRMQGLCEEIAARYIHLEVQSCPDTSAALQVVTERVRPGDLWLIKGSRGIGLDRLVDHLRNVYQGGTTPHAL